VQAAAIFTHATWPFDQQVRARDNVRVMPRRYFAPVSEKMRARIGAAVKTRVRLDGDDEILKMIN